MVEDGVEGMIVTGRDPKQIAQAMIRLASDRQLNLRMGEAAHAKGAVRNTWQHYGDRLLKLWQAETNDSARGKQAAALKAIDAAAAAKAGVK